MKAVILVGGKGRRLLPYTTILPKPLMPIGERPILEIVINQLKKHNITELYFAVGYLEELIKAYFGDGKRLGITITYSKEESPLGTAAPLSKISGLDDTFLVMNGDILTTIDFNKFIEFHRKNKACATIAVNKRNVKIDFGILNIDKTNIVKNYIEKPILDYSVSMGINILEPKVLKYIPKNSYFDFPELIKTLIKNNEKVIAYVNDAYWKDIGRKSDYKKAIEEFDSMKSRFLNENIINRT